MRKIDLISLMAIGITATVVTATIMPAIVAEVRSGLEHSQPAKKTTTIITKQVDPTENSAAQLVKFSLAIGAMAAIFKDWN